MSKVRIFWQSSVDMSPIPPGTVDLVVTSPPFNIGTEYGDYNDRSPWPTYFRLLERVFQECVRVLRPGGRFLVDVADTICSRGRFLPLATLVERRLERLPLNRLDEHVLIHGRPGRFAPTDSRSYSGVWSENADAHSPVQFLLVYGKTGDGTPDDTGRQPQSDVWWLPTDGAARDWQWTPETVAKICDSYLTAGSLVLDPFMGSSVLPTEVMRRQSDFVGFEVGRRRCASAAESLRSQGAAVWSSLEYAGECRVKAARAEA